jgi:ABC-type Fe3+-siderophore transport system permease subunit
MQILANIILYAFLAWQLYSYTIATWDPWMAFVVGFVVVVAIVLSLMPKLHAPATSPGAYPYDD